MTQKETMLLGEIKGQLDTIYLEHGKQFKTLFFKIDKMNEDGLPICKTNIEIIKQHDEKISELHNSRPKTINPFALISGGGGLAGVIGVLFFLIGKSKGWW